MFDLENSIKQWLKLFRKHQAFNHGSVREMELHLRDHIDDLVSDGYSEQQAFRLAVKEFGEIPNMAKEEFENLKTKTTVMSFIHTRLLNNYFKTLLRSLSKNPMTSFINVFGLAVAVGVCMVTYAFMDFDYGTDRFHEFKDEVYLTTYYVDREGTEEQYGTTPVPLGEMLRQDFTNIKKICRIEDGNVIMKYEDKVFHESVRYVDPEFLEMFTFPLKWGHLSALQDVNSIILSEEMAIKYFGDENPIDRDIKMIFDKDLIKTFKVSGVAKEFPLARTIDFGFLVNFKNLSFADSEYNLHNWKDMLNATFIQVKDSSNLWLIKQEMEKYKALQNEVESDWAISSFDFVSLHDLHLSSGEIRNDISFDGSEEGRIGLPVITIFILALACFNYINIAIVSAAKRLKEIGLRKVIGANRRLIIIQFLAENLFITFFAGILGLVLAITIFLPWFASFASIASEFNLLDPNMWFFLITVLFFTGIISGIYPAFYISKFEAAQIFKGTVRVGKKNTLTKSFLAIQLMLTCIGIAFAVMFAQNSGYQAKRNWGYNQKDALYVKVSGPSSYNQLSASLAQEPNILSVSGSAQHLGKATAKKIIQMPDRQYEVREISIDPTYFNTMGLELSKGRFFNQHHESDYKDLVVNELFIENLELEQPIGRLIKIDSVPHHIVGIVKNFHFHNFYHENQPTIFTLADKEHYQYLSMKIRNGYEQEMYQVLQSKWTQLFPEIPFQGGYQEDVWVGFYEDLYVMKKFSQAVSFVFVLLASLGLYGLVRLNISGRIREFSIRKTLGAGTKHIATNVFSQYVILSLIGVVLGAPLAHVLNTAMIDMMFPDPRPFGYSGAIISAGILILVLCIVIYTQVRNVANSNPVEGLKVE